MHEDPVHLKTCAFYEHANTGLFDGYCCIDAVHFAGNSVTVVDWQDVD